METQVKLCAGRPPYTLGNLIRVTDQADNVTTMTYNALGQKLSMNDPDMLAWSYTYDAAGNMLTQTDAKGTVTCFDYDRLNRLVAKRYDGDSSCPSTATEAYSYDQSGHGYAIGQRTMMTNTSAVVSWTYDRRGRVIAQTRTVPGMGVYTYRMGYNSANQVVTTTYPTGETLWNAYTAAGQPRVLTSTWTSYVTDAQYNVRGGLDWFKEYTGGSGYLQTSYSYYDAGSTPTFRLKQLDVSYTNGLSLSRLRLSYRYDDVGNVLAITDTQNANQAQSFGYDALDRLMSASANAGSGSAVGQYSDTYAYDALGSPTNMAGRAYDYAGSGHAHAVRYASVLGSGKFNNFTSSAAGWYVCPTYCALTTDGGDGVLRNGPSSGGGYTEVYSNGYSLTAGQSFQIEFKASRDSNPPDMILGLEAGDGAQRFAIIATPGENLRVQRKVWNSRIGTTWSYSQFAPAYTLESGTWYVLRLMVGDSGSNKFKVYLWKRDDPSVRRYFELAATPTEWVGKTWRIHNWTAKVGENNQVLLDSYMELLSASNGVWSYRYDANGNMISRVEQGIGYAQAWDAQNRLVQVTYGPITTTTNATYRFAYDADGGRVLQVAPNNYKTAYIGAYEETVTSTALFTQDFEAGTGNWTITGGTWNRYYTESDTYYYKQTIWEQPGESSAVIAPAVTYGEITATARVRLDLGTNVLAGLVLRRNTANTPAYFVGIRNSDSGYYCGIYEKSNDTWTVHTGQLTTCKYATGGWHTLMARVAGGRIEMYVDNTLIATWVDTDATLPAYGFGLMTFDGAASFDNIKVYGLSTRSYYMFGSARVAERTTSHWQAAGSGAAPSGGWVYYLAADHLGSTSLALLTSGVVTGTRAYYMAFGAERGPAASLPTDFTFTGQRNTFYIKMISMGARWYLPSLGRWASADTVVPGFANPQNLNRFSYVRNRPLAYIDPSGHCSDMPDIAKANDSCWQKYYEVYGKLNLGHVAGLSDWGFDALENLLTWLTRGIRFENGATTWSVDGIGNVMAGLNAAEQRFGGWDRMKPFLGLDRKNAKLTLGRRALADTICRNGDPNGSACAESTRIDFHNRGVPTMLEFVHELGHVVDDWLGGMTDADGKWSTRGLIGQGWEMQPGGTVFSLFGIPLLVRLEPRYVGQPHDPAPWSTRNINEDFADTFASWVLDAAPYQNVRSRTDLLNSVLGVP